jgi:hypothetical protein
VRFIMNVSFPHVAYLTGTPLESGNHQAFKQGLRQL